MIKKEVLMTDKLELQLDEIKINTIKDYHIINKEDELIVEIFNNDGSELTITFKEVNGYYYQDFDGLNDLELKPFSQNLDFISYYKHGFAKFLQIDMNNKEELHSSVPNFVINLIDSSIYVDANIIEINDEIYYMNYYN